MRRPKGIKTKKSVAKRFKITGSGNPNVLVTERGASFGYNTLVSDMRALPELAATGAPVVFDATHSVQQPGGQGSPLIGAALARLPVASPWTVTTELVASCRSWDSLISR